MSTGTAAEIDEELRLTYVATTRARDFLYVLWPMRYYSKSAGVSDRHTYAQCCRFFTPEVVATMEPRTVSPAAAPDSDGASSQPAKPDIKRRIADMWG